jgi:hypothetical protein
VAVQLHSDHYHTEARHLFTETETHRLILSFVCFLFDNSRLLSPRHREIPQLSAHAKWKSLRWVGKFTLSSRLHFRTSECNSLGLYSHTPTSLASRRIGKYLCMLSIILWPTSSVQATLYLLPRSYRQYACVRTDMVALNRREIPCKQESVRPKLAGRADEQYKSGVAKALRDTGFTFSSAYHSAASAPVAMLSTRFALLAAVATVSNGTAYPLNLSMSD